MKTVPPQQKVIFITSGIFFTLFLIIPLCVMMANSFSGQQGFTLIYFTDILGHKAIYEALWNSVWISLTSALLATLLAFVLAYTVHFTNISDTSRRIIRTLTVFPMLLPTITYGFAIIYSFGREGLITRLFFGHQLFNIYGFNGLLIGYILYILPVSFLLLDTAMYYIDKSYLIVCRVMGDSPFRAFKTSVLRPLYGALASSVIQCFFLCFTDFGIPASVGGRTNVIASLLYNQMIGSVPDFHRGAVIAFVMLVPSAISIAFLISMKKYNIRYNRISESEIMKGPVRDRICAGISSVILLCVLSIFAVIFIVPFVNEWPYKMEFSLSHLQSVFGDSGLLRVFKNSVLTSLFTAIIGTLIAYSCALCTARKIVFGEKLIEPVAQITNTIPGMVLGIAYLLTFRGTPLQNTIAIIVCCNEIHFFSTPYTMVKNSLNKMNSSWETTATLLGDTWFKTVRRIITPNALPCLLEVFCYFFINGMVTVSAVIFIAGARTMVATSKIKELQYYGKFNDIFVLSVLILLTNMIAKGIFIVIARKYTMRRGI